MTFQSHPCHIEGRVRSADDRFPGQTDEYHNYFQIVCQCGCSQFRAFLGSKKSLEVECSNCGKRIKVYDLARYPAATKLQGPEQFHLASPQEGKIYVMYEYGELDQDQPFDRNDITWFRAWIEDSKGELSLLLDDETA